MENKDADDNYQNLLEAGTNDSYFEIAEENLKKVFPEKYQFNTELGNSVYQSFLDSYDKYCSLLQQYKAIHLIDEIIHIKDRKAVKRLHLK